jgi:molybdenum cofactor cytidylyltransferase
VETKTSTVAVILLAAGKSERMGQNKLLLPFGEQLVLQRTLDNLMASRAQKIIVVLGAKATEIKSSIGQRNVTTVFNPNYEQGMSTSLSTGLMMMESYIKFVLVALGDQPLITTQTYDVLITAALNTDKGLLVPTYSGKRGNPIIVSTRYQDTLCKQSGDIGGRELLKAYPSDVLEVPVEDEGIVININTKSEYEKQIKSL